MPVFIQIQVVELGTNPFLKFISNFVYFHQMQKELVLLEGTLNTVDEGILNEFLCFTAVEFTYMSL